MIFQKIEKKTKFGSLFVSLSIFFLLLDGEKSVWISSVLMKHQIKIRKKKLYNVLFDILTRRSPPGESLRMIWKLWIPIEKFTLYWKLLGEAKFSTFLEIEFKWAVSWLQHFDVAARQNEQNANKFNETSMQWSEIRTSKVYRFSFCVFKCQII